MGAATRSRTAVEGKGPESPQLSANQQPGHDHRCFASIERVTPSNSGFRYSLSVLEATKEGLNTPAYIPQNLGKKKSISMF